MSAEKREYDLMSSSPVVLLGIAVLLGLLAAMMVKVYLERTKENLTGGKPVAVLVAAQNISAGSSVEEGMVKIQNVPTHYVHHDAISERMKEYLIGQVCKKDVPQGSLVLWSDLVLASDQTLGDRLKMDRRAITIKVDQVSGLDGLLMPGDKVDVLATLQLPADLLEKEKKKKVDADEEAKMQMGGGRTETVTRVLLQNVGVLAVDGVMNSDRLKVSGESGKKGKESTFSMATAGKGGKKEGPKAVTLDVDLEEAALLACAEYRGELRLVMRSRQDIFVENPKNVTRKDLVGNLPLQVASTDESRDYPIVYEAGEKRGSAYWPKENPEGLKAIEVKPYEEKGEGRELEGMKKKIDELLRQEREQTSKKKH